MKRYYFQIPLFLCLFFLCFGNSPTSNQSLPKDPMQIVMDQIDKSGAKLEKAYDILHVGYKMKGKFLHLELCFDVPRKMSKNESRKLLLNCAQEFMNDINANEELRPYLLEYPFTLHNVGINFYLGESDGADLYHPNYSFAACRPRGIEFITTDPVKKCGFKQVDEETHEEALALIKASQ